MPDDSFFANRPKKQQSLVGVPSGSLPRPPVGFSFSNVSLQIIIRSPPPRLGKFFFSDPKRVLQHYQGKSGRSSDIAFRSRLPQSCHQNARREGCACSITSICLERKKGAEPQEDDGSCN